ncbi:MAG: hypothetical protein PHY45_00980 [Rhodocyclaceae bacterium]|nr:hypothetical protein [Rhodocyclaceae bacterium]
MADSTTILDTISSSQAAKEVTANALFDAGSPSTLFGRRASTTAALTWGYYGGRFTKADGTRTSIANGTVALTASATNYLQADQTGVVSVNTSGFTAGQSPLYTIVAGASTVTSYTDERTGSEGTNAYLMRSRGRVANFTYASAITVDWSICDIARITLAGNPTLSFTGGVDGQHCVLELTQDATGSRTVTWPANARFSNDIPAPTLSTTPNKLDRIGFASNQAASKYDAVAVVRGF